jgi:hypothetical protein
VYSEVERNFTPGKQTVSYFLLQDCKSITYNSRTKGSRRGRDENKGERETQKEHLCRKLLELGGLFD